MLIEIPDNIIHNKNLTEQEIRVELAIILYKKNIMTIKQASDFTNLDLNEFQKKLNDTLAPIHYTEEDFKDDLNTIKKIFG